LCNPYYACAKTCPLGSVCFKFGNEEATILYYYADKEHPIDVTRYQKKLPSKADIEGFPEGALTISGESKTISELMDIIH
ncbi:choline TMA-lyase-activating enzyme, partial [Streptococcus suis]